MRLHLAILPVFAFLASCAGGPRVAPAPAPSAPRQPEISRPETVVDTGMDEGFEPPAVETSTPAQVQAVSVNPAAEALVAKGVESLNARDLNSAEWHLEEAIRLAPNYGPAYYWMARVKMEANEGGEAENFLNKAESLAPLGSAWYQRIIELRRHLAGGIK